MKTKAITFGVVGVVGMLCACGFAPERIEAFDVVLVPQEDCTVIAAVGACVDPALLAQRQTRARWIVEHAQDGTFLLTTHEGATIPGVFFNDDDDVFNEAPCVGDGGLCYFARSRLESTDERNNGCTTFSEFTIIMRRSDREAVEARVLDVRGTDQDCNAPTVLQTSTRVNGTLAVEPARTRESDS
jgi:hypothetical protein